MKYNNKEINQKNKKEIIKKLFNDVSSKYDLMNDLMSFGLHKIWKKDLIKYTKNEQADIILDLAGGTGDITNALSKNFQSSSIYLYDLSLEMINQSKYRKESKNKNIYYVNGNADQLAFQNNSIDLITLAFGLRNFSNIEKSVIECNRVLKYGKRIYILEFSPKVNEIIEPFYEYYSNKIIPLIGKKVAANYDAYKYLVESIKNFPHNKELKNIFTKNGFFCYNHKIYFGGIAHLNIFSKI